MKTYEFQIGDLLPIGISLVVLGIALAFGLNIMSDVGGEFTNATSPEALAVDDAIEGVAKLPEKLPIIATTVVAAILIGIVIRYLMVR